MMSVSSCRQIPLADKSLLYHSRAGLSYFELVLCVVCQYMEKLSDGRNVVRSEAAESRVARQHELQRQRRVETLLTKIQHDMEHEYNGIIHSGIVYNGIVYHSVVYLFIWRP